MLDGLIIEPACDRLGRLARHAPDGVLFEVPLGEWRRRTRCELGLAGDRPIIATGHQTLLWHPGILAKYLLVDAVAAREDLATANLIVDQHADRAGSPAGAGRFGVFDVPVRRRDGTLASASITLGESRSEVPMALHPPFTPAAPPALDIPLDSARAGLDRILAAVRRHGDASDAARQMAAVLTDLMRPWVVPMPGVTATALAGTDLARALLAAMVRDPHRCAAAYNRAVTGLPEAGIRPLLVRDDYVEMPLWRIREDGRRMHAYDGDLECELERGPQPGGRRPTLMPRALFMTALVRLGMCDLFVHGTGGARYDRAMERWLGGWLDVDVAPLAVATATMRLPLGSDAPVHLSRAIAAERRLWHDPERSDERGPSPGPTKRRLLERLEAAPRHSTARRRAFHALHDELERLRATHAERVEVARARVARARRQAAERPVTERRTWPFPLYADVAIDTLAAAVRARVECDEPALRGETPRSSAV